jgi:hypothetical protein
LLGRAFGSLRPAGSVIAAVGLAAASTAPISSFDPNVPGRFGYRLVFASEFDRPDEVARRPSGGPARWFSTRFFGSGEGGGRIAVADGALNLGGGSAKVAQVQTAAPAANAVGWSGIAVRGGGYFEARIRLGPDPGRIVDGWPAFWAMAVEHLALRGAEQWSGQPQGFTRFIEDDFFEINQGWLSGAGYVATLHDWYGIWKTSCPGAAFCSVNNQGSGAPDTYRLAISRTVDWSKYHTIGQLIRTSHGSTPGMIVNYFDGAEIGQRLYWEAGDRSGAPPRGRQAFNTLDTQGLVVILNSGQRQMQVDYVRVWQNAAGRLEVMP